MKAKRLVKNKNIGITSLIALGLVISMILPMNLSYAKEESFFEVENTQVSLEQDIVLNINLDKITYSKFMFYLTSTQNLDQVNILEDAVDEEQTEQIEIEKEENELTIELDKSKVSLDKISLNYVLPENVKVGDIITFDATIISLDDDDKNEEEEKQSQSITCEVEIIEEAQQEDKAEDKAENMDTDKETNTPEQSSGKDNMTQDIKDVGTNVNTNSFMQDQNSSFMTNSQGQSSMQDTSSDMKSTSMQSSDMSSQADKISTTQISENLSSTKTEQTVTYNGSDNNYLASLEITGYELTKDFAKDSLTYFVNVDEGVTSLEVIASAEDENATVYIYGADELSTGTNKILVSVVAENSNIRNYRIYAIVK